MVPNPIKDIMKQLWGLRRKGDICLKTTLIIVKKDPSERACRIWKFWKDKISDDCEFIFYQSYLWLVFLTQLSSFANEKLFSQIKIIVDKVGQNMTEEITELRIFLM